MGQAGLVRLLGALAAGAQLLTLAVPVSSARGAERPHVYVICVDGLDAAWLPHMAQVTALRASGSCPITYPEARAVMPARTNPNHVSLLTAVYPAAHGITGNHFLDRTSGDIASGLDAGAAIEVETLFTVVESDAPELRTVAVVGKTKLGHLLGAVPGRQLAPDAMWMPPGGVLGLFSVNDETVMNAAVGGLDPEPDLFVVSLPGLDGTSHLSGMHSDAAREAVAVVDRQIGRLARELQRRGRWERSIMVILGDHGFTDVRPLPGRRVPYVSFSQVLKDAGMTGLRAVSDGGVAHVYVEDLERVDALDAADIERLRAARALALRTPGVAEALYRLPVPGDGDAAVLTVAHPSWRMDHPSMGELILVGRPSVMFSDPPSRLAMRMLGTHGGPGELEVPLIFCGGSPHLRRDGVPLNGRPSVVDAAATVFSWLGMRQARRLDGRAVATEHRGRPLAAVMAPAGDGPATPAERNVETRSEPEARGPERGPATRG